MACGAIITFDADTDAAVRRLWQCIEDAGLPSSMLGFDYPPHLTLLVCEGIDLNGLRGRLPGFISSHPPIPAGFAGLGVFADLTPVVHLPVTKTPALEELHSQFWEMAAPFIQGESPYYRPDAWFPHVTLNRDMPLSTAGSMIDALLAMRRPTYGLLRTLNIVDFPTSDSGIVELFSARLGSYL